ncbi:MAG: hypothetical protein H0T46_34420 [Deltaproteobacteria bacterium]|nr:hypothetical protein [Deltaproteobacteria bacterium]
MSRTTYERLKAFCETNNISMSQLVETRVNDFLGEGNAAVPTTITNITPRPMPSSTPARPSTGMPSTSNIDQRSTPNKSTLGSEQPAAHLGQLGSARPSSPAIPMTSAAARFAVDPPPPIIKPKQPDTNAPKPAEKRPDQIFTF